MRRRARAIACLAGLVGALTIASSAFAASPWISIRQQGISAASQRVECTENGDGTLTCEVELLDAFRGRLKFSGSPTTHAEQVCYEKLNVTVDAETGELIDGSAVAGCALDANTVTVRSLGSITLARTRIELTKLTCDAFDCTEHSAGHATVQGRWTSAGRAIRARDRFAFDDGFCLEVVALQARDREARFRGTVDGSPLAADISLVSAGTFRLRVRCMAGVI
jgi:hypothetical protein